MGRKLTILSLALTVFATAAGVPRSRFASPIEVVPSADGARVYILCEGTDEVAVYDTQRGAIVRRIPVGRAPKGLSLAAGGTRLYVANSWSDTVSEIDTSTLTILRTLPAGYEPNAAIADLAGRFLYVANRISNDISVVDLASGEDVKRLAAGRGVSYLALSPDGALLHA